MSKSTKNYKEYLTTWPREAGPKPKASELAAVHATGRVRPGSRDALAVAMSLRGVTQGEIKAVLGAPHRNKMRELVKAKIARRLRVPRKDGLKVYKLELVQRQASS
jgi:hypothetical protein